MDAIINKAAKHEDRSAWPKPREGEVIAYVDGSFSEAVGRYAYGCILFALEEQDEARYELSGFGTDPEVIKIRNIAGEMLASMQSVLWAIKGGYQSIEIRYDYAGIEMWAERKWKAKNEFTEKYAVAMNRWREKIAIHFQKVEAHSGDHWNDAADKLAKAALMYEDEPAASEKTAVVAGHICIDITPVFPAGTPKCRNFGQLLKPGKLLQMSGADVHTGGAVANTGIAMKRLGADVRLIGKAGKDAFGGMIRDILDEYGAGEDLIFMENETTSYSVVLAAPGIDRTFLHCPGANDTFDGTEISGGMLRGAALFHFGYPTIMRRMYCDGGKAMAAMFRRVKEQGIATSLDLSMADPDSEAGRADWAGILAKTLPYVDFFVPSFEELCFMLDRPRYESLLARAEGGDITEILDLSEDIMPLAEKCLDLGARAVLLKCGAPGLYLRASDRMDGTGERLGLDADAWNGFGTFETSYRVDRVLSGTGAGDACIAAFLASLLKGCGPKESIEHAAAAGALSCTAYDAVSGLLPLEEIRRRIDEGWGKRTTGA